MAYVRANMFYEREQWKKPLLISAGFHLGLVAAMIVLGWVLKPRAAANWGENQGDE